MRSHHLYSTLALLSFACAPATGDDLSADEEGVGGGGPGSGGLPGDGGSDSGGSLATGGEFSSAGGAVGSGSAAGGTVSSGGNPGVGGEWGAGGGPGSGGTADAIGGASTGGVASGGGAEGVGGSSAGGDGVGGSLASSPSDLPPPKTSGVPRPSGTPGGLVVLNWAGFSAAYSYTFDDANSSQISNYAALQALGVPFTFYLQTGKSDASNAIWSKAVLDGHELGNHTKSHNSLDPGGADTDLATSFIETKYGVTPLTMAAPNGSTDYGPIAQTRFMINRGVSGGAIMPNGNSDRFNLPCDIPVGGATAATMKGPVDAAMSAKAWRVFLVHGFSGGSDGAYQAVGLSQFVETVEYAKSLDGLWIDTVLEVGAYWIGQKLLSSASPQSSGQDTKWTWTLPEHFPTGRILRVTVDGGNLSQAGQPIAWDEHGYYEIALDVEELTLSP